MKLSTRLETILQMTLPCETAADIGCDHAFAAIELVRRGIAGRAVASDIRKGPLKIAAEHVEEAGLQDRIPVRLGSGLDPLAEGEADAVLIAGMGGKLMRSILLSGAGKLGKVKQLVLSPHTDAGAVREAAEDLGFRIAAETLAKEDGKYYTVIRAEKEEDAGTSPRMTERERTYGPCLLRERPPLFLEKLKKRRNILKQVLRKLSGAEDERRLDRRNEILREIAEITEILEEGKDGLPDRDR